MADEQVVQQDEIQTPPPEVEPPQPEVPSEGETPESEPPKPPEPSEADKRLHAAERETERHRKRADYWMQNYQKVVAPPTTQPQAQPDPEPEDPGPDGNQVAYVKAWNAWNTRQELAKAEQKQVETRQRDSTQAQQDAIAYDRNQRLIEVHQRDPEAWTAADSVGKMGVGEVFKDTLFESDQFEKLVKHLAANPPEVQRIMWMSPIQQVREITKIEHKLAAASAAPPLRQTSAPPPVKPVNGGGAPMRIDLNDPKVPMVDWVKEHDRLERKKRTGK